MHHSALPSSILYALSSLTRRLCRIGLLLLAAGVAACSGGTVLDGPGVGESYEPGLPNFDFAAIPTLTDGEPGIDIYASIPRTSLVFTTSDSTLVAAYDLTVRVMKEGGRDTEAFLSLSDTLNARSAEAARTLTREVREGHIAVAPGAYVVEATLEDAETGEQAVRRQRVEVPGPESGPTLAPPLVHADLDGDGTPEPVVSLHLPVQRDSLWVTVGVADAPDGAVLTVRALRLRADTTVATPPFWVGASRSSLFYRGVDLSPGSADTLYTSDLTLGAAQRWRDVAFALPSFGEGIVQLDLRLLAPDGVEIARRQRLVSIKGPAFPRLVTLEELVEALDYIAYPRETEFIEAGATARERRQRFDAFWGSLVSDRRVAQSLLRQYYERVEEANVLFTSHKEGWKTDRGMVYVVFGAPGYVERTFEGEVWHYGYGAQDAAGTFTFERTGVVGERDPFGHVVLIRQPVYERAWTRAIRRWREGAVR